jgi:WD40 repeat protein
VLQQDAETVSLAKDHCANFGIIPQKLFNQPHLKREQKVKVMAEFPPMPLEGNILVCSGGYVLTSTSSLIHLQNRVTTHVDAFKWNQYSICVISTSYIISAGSDEVCVHVFNHKENTEKGLLPHRTSILNCFALASESLLLTGGSDCSLYFWDLATLTLLSKIPNHSVPIIAVAACAVLDLCVSINEEGTVSIVELTERRILHAFSVVDKKAHTRGVKMAKSGLIIVGAVPGNAGDKSNVSFYDLTGKFRGTVDIHGIIQEMELIGSEE